MAHKVTFKVPERELGRTDVEFKVNYAGSVIGKLKVSKGALEWVTKDDTYGYKLPWKEFDELMRERGKKK